MLKSDLRAIEYLDNIHYTALPSPIRQPVTLTAMGCFQCGGNYYTKRDGLKECLLIYTLDGCGELEYHGGSALLTPGTVTLINCFEPQYYGTHGDRWQFAWVHFHGDLAFEYEEAVNGKELYVNRFSRADFLEIYAKLKQLAESDSSQGKISLNLHRALELVLQSKEHTDGAMEQAAEYIRQNFQSDADIDFLAAIAGYSKFYFIRQFRKYYGSTPYRYMLSARVNEAKRLLTSTDMPVNAIALKIGFADSKSFIYNFKNLSGTTPLQYRKDYL